MSYNLSTNMSLPIPVVGSEAGPQYATDVNNSLTLIDQHDHSSGSGVQITPDGLNINSDLSISSNNLTLVRSLRFDPQSAALALATDIGCLYEAGVDLYYNDALGNQIRLTQSGGVAGTSGSISNLTPPASASYDAFSTTFVFQSGVTIPANIDGGSFIFRNISAASNGVTVQAPAALASDYSITLPALPASQKVMTLNAAGTMAAPYSFDNSTIVTTGNVIQVPDAGITRPKLVAVGQQISGTCGHFNTSSTSYVDITNFSVTITTTGRPVVIGIQPTPSTPKPEIHITNAGQAWIGIQRDGATIVDVQYPSSTGDTFFTFQPFMYLDTPAAGTYVYKLQAKQTAGTGIDIFDGNMVVFEL